MKGTKFKTGKVFHYFGSVRNAQLQLTLKGVSPPPLWLPDAITSEQMLRHHRSMRGAWGDSALSPPYAYQPHEFHIKGKGILQSA